MLLKYINSNRISVIALFLLLPVACWLPSMIQGSEGQFAGTPGIQFGRWIVAFNNDLRVLASLIALMLIIANGFLLIQLNTVHIFIPYRTQLPLFFYTMFTLSITQLHHLTPALISSTIVLLAFYRVFSAYKADNISINFMDAGLLIATASLFYFYAIFFFLFIVTSLILTRPFIWREWVFALIGLILPYVFVISGYYLLDISLHNFFKGIGEEFAVTKEALNLSQYVFWIFVLFLTLVTSYFMVTAIDSMKIHARKFFLVFLMFFLVSLLVFLIFKGPGSVMVYFAAIPLSYLFSHYFIRCRRNWANEIFLTLLIILLIWTLI